MQTELSLAPYSQALFRVCYQYNGSHGRLWAEGSRRMMSACTSELQLQLLCGIKSGKRRCDLDSAHDVEEMVRSGWIWALFQWSADEIS